MGRTFARNFWIALVTVLMSVAADPAAAQEGAGAGRQTSAFQRFFWVDDDIFGLLLTWALIVMSFVVVSLVIKHLMINKKPRLIPEESVAMYAAMLEEKRYADAIEQSATDPSLFGQVLHASLSEASNGYGAMERASEETADLASSKRVRDMEVLNVMGAVGPMIGLFGTVYGMIAAFYTIVDKGGTPDPAELAAGVGTALVTTFWGLIVGIPAVAAVALIRAKIDGLTVETMVRVEGLISRFRPSRKAASGAAPGARTGPPGARPAGEKAPAAPVGEKPVSKAKPVATS
jgi:biopolymer transport protein ExbB